MHYRRILAHNLSTVMIVPLLPHPTRLLVFIVCIFFFNDTATTEIYTLSLHDALPISPAAAAPAGGDRPRRRWLVPRPVRRPARPGRARPGEGCARTGWPPTATYPGGRPSRRPNASATASAATGIRMTTVAGSGTRVPMPCQIR